MRTRDQIAEKFIKTGLTNHLCSRSVLIRQHVSESLHQKHPHIDSQGSRAKLRTKLSLLYHN